MLDVCYRFPMVRTGGSTNTLNETRSRLETLSPCIAMVTIMHYDFENVGEHSGFDDFDGDDDMSHQDHNDICRKGTNTFLGYV